MDLGLSERKWKLAGIPYRYFSVKDSVLRPLTYEYSLFNSKYVVSDSIQTEALKSIFSNPNNFNEPSTVGFSSCPHDDGAMAAAAFTAKFVIAHSIDCKFINVAEANSEWTNFSNSLKVLFFYNIAYNSTPERLERTRDLIRRHDKKFKIVVIGGITPVDFFHKNLCTYLDAGFNFNGVFTNSEVV